MRRREFIALIGGVVAWPRGAHAQQPGKTWRIGIIAHQHRKVFDALFERLRELGYIEGNNVTFERRYADGNAERFQQFAAELVRLRVDIIIVFTTPAALATKSATTTIPIVFPNAIDPVGAGVIASLARPGGNITGGALLIGELSAKRLELLKEVMPTLSRAAIIWNAANRANALAWKETQSAARSLTVMLQFHEVRRLEDFDVAFAGISKERPDGLIVLEDALTLQHRNEVIRFAIAQKLPSVFALKELAEAGGLISYGPRLLEMMHGAADYVDKILKGAKPADLPFVQAAKFELVINLKTAKALGITVPPTLFARADEVIE